MINKMINRLLKSQTKCKQSRRNRPQLQLKFLGTRILPLKPMTSSEDLLGNLLKSFKIMTKKMKKMMHRMFKQMKKKHRSPKKECLHDFKSRYTKMKQIVRKLKKQFKNISTQWTFQTRAYQTERQNAQCRSKMTNMPQKMKFLASLREISEAKLVD